MVNDKSEIDPKKEFCSNSNCRNYGKRDAGNIVKYGHDKNGKQRFKCKTCSSVFVETKNTVFYNRKLSEDQIIMICKLLVEKNGIRAIERIMEIHRDTVSDVIKDLARHAREVTDFLIKDVGLTKVQVDEMWSFIKKNKKTLTKEMKTQINMANARIYIAKKADTKLHLAHSTGKRVQETADELMETVRKRFKMPTADEKAIFASNGNDQYIYAILKNFDRETINYGQIIKERENGRVVGKIRKIIFGEMDDADIDTIHIERYNLTMRNGISRLIRKSLCFSKCKKMLDNHIDVYECYNNLIRVNSSLTIKTKKGERNLKRTACMVEGVTDHVWTWKELLMFKVGINY